MSHRALHTCFVAVFLVFAACAAEATPRLAWSDGVDHVLQREMERLYAMRTADPPAFIAQSRSLDALPAPTSLAQREFLQLLRAIRFASEGSVPEAIELALPLADAAADPRLRLRAEMLVINLQGANGQFEDALRRLESLLRSNPASAPSGLREDFLSTRIRAAALYNFLGQHLLAKRYADEVLGADPVPSMRLRCQAGLQLALAGASMPGTLNDAHFAEWNAWCAMAGETRLLGGFLVLAQIRHLHAERRTHEALKLMVSKLGMIESTQVPALIAKAQALDAELLLATGKIDAAERQAHRAIETSHRQPNAIAVAEAEKILHQIARDRGDENAALRHLQAYAAATRALAEEDRIKALAVRTVKHEVLQREQTLEWQRERHRVLNLQAQAALAESREALLALGILVGTILLLGIWAWRWFVEERRFRVIAQTDALTGFINRQHFTLRAEATLARCARIGQPVMLICFDLDHFKRINDRFGHLAGDAVLRAVSAAVRAVPVETSMTRTLGRIGGEEFAVLLEGATLEVAARHAEACRLATAQARAQLSSETSLAVTASFGIAGTPDVGYRLDTLFAAADRALYRAKSAGRDRVSMAAATPSVSLEAA